MSFFVKYDPRSPDGATAPPNVHDIVIFDVLNGVGLAFLLPILYTALRSTNIKRASTWFMVTGSWVVTSLSSLILVGQQTGPPPRTSICLMQAMLVYASPVLCSFSAVAFMLQVYLSIVLAVKSNSKISRTQTRLLHLVPCISFFCVLIEVLIVGLLNPQKIRRDPSGMYCNLSGPISYTISAGVTVLAMIMVIVIEFLTAIALRRIWKSSTKGEVQNNEFLSMDVIARVAAFSFCPMVALAVSLFQYVPNHDNAKAKFELVVAALPCCAVLIFGSQRDILRAWMFWGKA